MNETHAEARRRPPSLLLLLLVTAGVMAPALWGDFVYDDIPLVLQNPRVHSLTAPILEPLWGHEFAYWRPFAGTLMAISLACGGAMVLHAFSLAIHLVAVAVAFGLARDLTKNAGAGLFVAILFALHPVQVESFAWGAAVQDPLVGLFVLCSLHALVRWRESGSVGPPRWTVCAFALALLSKETGVIALPAMILLDRLVLRPATGRSRGVYLALVTVLVVYLLLRMWVFGSLLAGWDRAQIDPTIVGSRRFTAPVEVLGEFTKLLVLPWPLLPFRAVAAETSAAAFFAKTVWLLLPLGLLGWAWRTGRRVAVFGIGLALISALIPAVNFHAIGSFPIADRYLYVPVFGFALVLAPRASSRGHVFLGLGLGVIFAVLDSIQIPVWRTQEDLIEHGLNSYPEDPSLLNMRGNAQLRAYQAAPDASVLQAAGNSFRLAIANTRESSALDPKNWRSSRDEAQLGLALCELLRAQSIPGQSFTAAIRQFEACTRAVGAPVDAWIGLGVSYGSAGRLDLAEPALQEAVAMAPWHDSAHYNLGFLYSQTGRHAKAIEQLETAVRLQPANQKAASLLERLQ